MRLSILAIVIYFSIIGLSSAADADAAIRKPVSIPAQNLGSALQTFGRISQLHIIFVFEDVNNIRSSGAAGDLTQEEALRELLSGTGLTYQYLDSGTVSILPSGSGEGAKRPAVGPAYSDGVRPSDPAPTKESDPPSRFSVAQADQGSSETSIGRRRTDDGALDTRGQLEEVVVTARKRVDVIQNVPQSISAVPGAELENVGANQLEDYFNYIPGLNFLSAGQLGEHELSLRGVTTGLSGSSTVGIYVDDVPFGSTSGFAEGGLLALDLVPFDLNRIEVLRGPQGTLYGSNTLGGLLKYVTNQPNPNKFEGLAQLDGSSVDHGDSGGGGKLMLNIPLSPGVAALRVSGYREQNPGWIENATLGDRDVNRSIETGGRAALLLTPTAAFSIKFAAILQDLSTKGTSLEDVNTTTHAPVTGRFQQSRNIAEPFKERFRQYSGTVKWDFNSMELVSVTSYQTLWALDQADQTLAFGLPSFGKNTITTNKFNQELRLLSVEGQPIEWLIGAAYANENGQQLEDFEFLPPVPGLPLVFVTLPSKYRENGIFGDLTWHLTPKLDLAFGARWNKDNQDFSVNETGAVAGPTAITTSGSSTDKVWTWLINPSYHLTPDVMIYARFATGYRPGGPNVVLPGQILPPTFGPDKTTNYEVGVKSQLLEKRATLDVAAFDINWTNIQLLQRFGNFTAFGNGSTARSQGLELLASYRPIANLTVGLNGAYTKASLTGPAPAVGGADGDPLPNVPRYSGAFTADYESAVAGNLRVFGGVSDRFDGAREAAFSGTGCLTCSLPFHLRAYNAVDLRVGATNGSWRAELFAKNVTNKRGELTAITPAANAPPQPTNLGLLQPRTIGIVLSQSF